MSSSEKGLNLATFALVVLVVGVLGFNQYQIMTVEASLGNVFNIPTAMGSGSGSSTLTSSQAALKDVDIESLNSTAQTLVAVFPELKLAADEEAIMELLIPTGTPEYSEALGGITFDDPTNSLTVMKHYYKQIEPEVKADAALWERYLNLASKPRGISCEYCCGVGPAGVSATGQSKCGCAHHPALLGLTLGLLKHTDYSDAEILREVMKWKTIFFPQKMITLALESAGKDPSEIEVLPQQVGGC